MSEEVKDTSTCQPTDCSSCGADCSSRQAPPKPTLREGSKVKKVIGVVSGKGGVGKSMITTLLARDMNKRGYNTAILDADITGPSIPHGLGVEGEKPKVLEDGLTPVVSKEGIKVMSINFLLPESTAPVVWRGPVISQAVTQFWTDVEWGDVDFMFVDMPPGTGDVPLTVFQTLPVDGIVIVASPQDLVAMIVAKAVNMAELMEVPIIGLVENMAYVVCPDCGKKLEIFGSGKIEAVAEEHNLKYLGSMPLDPKLAAACDAGDLGSADGVWPEAIGDAVAELLAN